MKFKTTYILLLVITALFLTSCNNCPTGDPENLIPEAQAIDMKNLFLEMDSGVANGDNTDVTFDLQDVQKYLHKMSELGSDQGYEKLGLRVHFARKIENGIPKRTVFFETVAPLGEGDDTEPIRFSKWKTLPQSSFYNIGDGGNNKVPTDTTSNSGR